MKQTHNSMRQGNDQGSHKPKDTHPNVGETIATCTMNPCTMKTESKNSASAKCPECGKTDVPEKVKKE